MDSEGVYGDDAEASLQMHVRSILHDYILEHLTIEQAQYTSEMVAEVSMISRNGMVLNNALQFVSNLTTIPSHEPSSLALPVDPLESLRTTLKLDSLKPYEETFAIDGEAISYIKSQLFIAKCKPKSQRIWDETAGGKRLVLA